MVKHIPKSGSSHLYFITRMKNNKHVNKCILKRLIKANLTKMYFFICVDEHKAIPTNSIPIPLTTKVSTSSKSASQSRQWNSKLNPKPLNTQFHLWFRHFRFILKYLRKSLKPPTLAELVYNFKWLENNMVDTQYLGERLRMIKLK